MQTPTTSSDTPQCANSSKEHGADVSFAESAASLRCSDDIQLLGEKAARIFLDRALADLGDQIYHMKDRIEQNEPLRNFVNDIEFRSGEEIHHVAKLEDSEFFEPEGSDYKHLKLSSVQPIPFSKLRYGSIVLANQCLWEFDSPLLAFEKRCGNEVVVEFTVNGSIIICGTVDKLSQEHLQLDDNMLATAILGMIESGNTIATFTPMNFRLHNRSLTETLLYTYKDKLEISSSDVPLDESDELNKSIIKALGTSEDIKVLESFNEMMVKDFALFSLSFFLDTVSFCHDGTVSHRDRLSKGELKDNDHGGHLWVLPVSNTCVNDPMELSMRLSGAIYTPDRQVIRLIASESGEVREVTVAIHFYPSGIADARVPLDDFDVDDEHFLDDLMDAFSGGDLDIILDSVSIELSVIEETLTKLGIDPYHHSKDESDDDTDDDTNDESEYSYSYESCSEY